MFGILEDSSFPCPGLLEFALLLNAICYVLDYSSVMGCMADAISPDLNSVANPLHLALSGHNSVRLMGETTALFGTEPGHLASDSFKIVRIHR